MRFSNDFIIIRRCARIDFKRFVDCSHTISGTVETILGRNNASMGFNRLRYTRRASTAPISGAIGAREKNPHRLHHKYQRASATVLAYEIAGGRLQFFDCHFTCCVGRRCRSGRCTVSHVTAGCAHRPRLRCDHIECHFNHNSYGGQYKFVLNFCVQLGKITISPYAVAAITHFSPFFYSRFTHCWPNI